MAQDQGALVMDSRQINIQLDLLANRILAPADITMVQAQLLLYILRHSREGASATVMQRVSGHSKATISKLVQRLREKGYVEALPCRQDDRRRLLYGTDEGRRLEGFLTRSIRAAYDRLFQDFSDEELNELDRLQKKMLRNLAAGGRAREIKEAYGK